MKLWAIVQNTFRETVRDRVLYNLLVFAVLMIGLSMAMGRLSFNERERMIVDFGLTAISAFGVLMSIFLGIGLVHKEIEKKTIHTLIAKPIPRWTYILGRYLGLMLTIAVNLAIMALCFGTILVIAASDNGPPLTWPIAQALIMIFVELAIIVSVAMVFSSFSTPALSAIFTLAFFVIGRFTAGIKGFAERAEDPFFRWSGLVLYYAVPNLTNYVRIESALYGEGLPAAVFLRVLLIGVLTAAFFVALAMTIFQRRDFV